jgi:nicotinamide phosphoribosyltransferase
LRRKDLKLLILNNGVYQTVSQDADGDDILQTVFENGRMVKEYSFDEIRARAAL